ncbi:MAG: sialidase family protein [Planctomycetota bacterium]|nr:sialidase family protein [Planctomycetota bacterium]
MSINKFGANSPFVRLDDGSLAVVSGNALRISRDGAKTWSEPRVIYSGDGATAKSSGPGIPNGSGQFFKTKKGVLVVVWREQISWKWDNKANEPDFSQKVNIWSIRSLDGGKTWQDRHKVFDGIVGHPPMKMVETASGDLVFPVQFYQPNPGRNVIRTYRSSDEGKTWQPSNIIDLGGHGHHDGALEPTMIELKDGRIWMLIRTNWDRFWEAFSDDQGRSWSAIRPSAIAASTSPGNLTRLADGRLALLWNQLYPEGKDSYERRSGQLSDKAASWHREELSIAFSSDEGKTWTKPIVLVRQKKAWLAYPYLFEPQPGKLWIFTGQGKVKIEANAADLVSKGYSIPIIDLAAQKHRQVLVDKEPGQYLGHPTTVLLEDGKTMIVVYPKGHGRGPIVMKRSSDGGLTWSDRLPTPENWATSKEVPTIYRVVDPKGAKRLIMFSGLYPNRMAVSEDDGANWSPLKSIGDFGGIVSMASCVRLKNGHYLSFFHDDGRFLRKQRRPDKFEVFTTESDDGGLSWSEPKMIATHPTAHLCEPGVFRSPDGKQLACLLRENSRKLNSFVVFSDDEGRTWTKPRQLPAALTGDRHAGRYAPDGRLFISFRDNTLKSPTKGDWVGWVGTYDDIVQGRQGQYRVRLMENHKGGDCAYPGVECLPDGTFVTTTYGHWIKGEKPFIMSVRFKLGELDSMVKQ